MLLFVVVIVVEVLPLELLCSCFRQILCKFEVFIITESLIRMLTCMLLFTKCSQDILKYAVYFLQCFI